MTCPHTQTIESPECETVCLSCGLVIHCSGWATRVIVDELYYGEVQTYLEDLIQNAHIYEGIIGPTLHLTRLTRSNPELKTFGIKEIACFCLYSELIKNNVGRTLKEIAYYGGTDAGRLYKIQKQLKNTDELEPCQLLDRIMDETQIPYSFRRRLNQIIDTLSDICSSKPETKVVCAIIICCEEKAHRVDKKELCNHVNVQWPSVRSLIKRFQQGGQ